MLLQLLHKALVQNQVQLDDQSAQTISHLNTPFNNQVAKEITVTDPTHPLFGRTFPVSSFSSTAYKGGNVSVIYRDDITLHIPFFSTNLASKQDFLTSK
ncbi:Y4bD/Y4pK family protein [Wolbachia endosymbiont of Delia radicum]|nr:Y4bD/Y4pK family protein [Wolbachia endosymbiont of Delia radicum]UJQ21017.1 Y4bD/Y4pK family protein [Wolbachia endosymbiont of Delia radicum]